MKREITSQFRNVNGCTVEVIPDFVLILHQLMLFIWLFLVRICTYIIVHPNTSMDWSAHWWKLWFYLYNIQFELNICLTFKCMIALKNDCGHLTISSRFGFRINCFIVFLQIRLDWCLPILQCCVAWLAFRQSYRLHIVLSVDSVNVKSTVASALCARTAQWYSWNV